MEGGEGWPIPPVRGEPFAETAQGDLKFRRYTERPASLLASA